MKNTRERVFFISIGNIVGVRRIELRHLAPKASVLPVYDTPTMFPTPRKRTTWGLLFEFTYPTRFKCFRRFVEDRRHAPAHRGFAAIRDTHQLANHLPNHARPHTTRPCGQLCGFSFHAS